MRRLHDIHGGIHPPANKARSLTQGIRRAPLAGELVLPLAQHIGAESEPIVALGERVLKGQMIARATTAISAALHAPTSGEIIAIGMRPFPHPSGMDAMAVVLRPDGTERWIERSMPPAWEGRSSEELLDAIRDAGIVGLGGAGFPSAAKLVPGPQRRVHTLIINGAECEPYITADESLMIERAAEIIEGARIIARLLDVRETLIAIEDDKPRAIAAMRAAADASQEVVVIPSKYPSGGERQLIQILTGEEVPAGGLPSDIGMYCQNVGTAAAVYRAIVRGEPLISRITTVTGGAVSEPGNFEVLLGTPMQVLLDAAGCSRERLSRLLMGGPMMGFALNSATLPVIKTTNCVLAASAGELSSGDDEEPCIRCGLCAEACPVSLLPQQLYWYSRSEDQANLEKHRLFDCTECGACAWVCPSSIPLVQYFRASKATLRQNRKQHEKAEHARQRFEQRQARLGREEQAKEARRKARKPAAAIPESTATPAIASPDEPLAPTVAAEDEAARRAREVMEAIDRVKARKLANTTGPTRDIVGAAIERARAQAIERVTSPQAAAPKAAPTREMLENRLAVTEKKLLRSAEKLAEAHAEHDAATIEVLERTRREMLQRRDQLRAELGLDTAAQN